MSSRAVPVWSVWWKLNIQLQRVFALVVTLAKIARTTLTIVRRIPVTTSLALTL